MTPLVLQPKYALGPCPSLADIRVLLVEDEPDIAALLVLVLETAGAAVTALTDAETALALLEVWQPDILLCNVRLPLQDGNWLIQQIRQHACSALRLLPAIALTSYTRDVCESTALAAGFDRFLVKFEASVVDEMLLLFAISPKKRTTPAHGIVQRLTNKLPS
jgi:CheY-like chemotaxis protein